MQPVLGAIEGGGTKFIVGVRRPDGTVQEKARIPTTTPDATLRAAIDALRPEGVSAVGFACFGPLDLAQGRTLETPKAGWDDVPLVHLITTALAVPVALDTDVNAAALAEATDGAAAGLGCVLYVTVGTGVGGGVCVDGRPHRGALHPEIGHLKPRRLPGDRFPGVCPFHGDCLEGLVSGPALRERAGKPAETLDDDDPIWAQAAAYLGEALASATYVLAPHAIVLGGGVGRRADFRQAVRVRIEEALGGYGRMPGLLAPRFEDSGLMGAFRLAEMAAGAKPQP